MRKPSFCRDFCEDAARLKITSRRILKKFNYTTPPLVSNNPPYATFLFLSAAQAETYSAALAELVNAQSRQPFATWWGEGTTSSSDGQNFKVGNKAESTGHINPKYGSEPGRTFYTLSHPLIFSPVIPRQ